MDPQLLRLVIVAWYVPSLLGKEAELVREVDKYQLDIVGLT